ncbi:dTDP-4-dehydrorhamnose reductase [Novosphingobium sp. LASN5T]|uniref:dTDP-4-dehydrorhamnose reductase n=1 Tax=Novosphingobium sp. LASN5T TaxID=2491021 RepID=UPI000F5F3502|nr:dTDP-4-dehydrorhamnose reductase [Novosphingobium sp. LASN5T]RQW37009.1 dTDP-4-dehydrorhamnose reductase [Novosphingobium sp. LASN5T]
MRIAVTGRTGQVASALIEQGRRAGYEIVALSRPELDLSCPSSVLPALEAARPDVVVSAAAYTAVDKAESERELAFAINSTGAGAVAEAARAMGLPLLHLSTDYVFDGKLGRPYREDDTTAPTGVYGASKLAGEQAVLAAHGGNSAVLRVAWIFSPFGGNFVKTMLRLAADRDEISVVADQIGSPGNAFDIADGVLRVADNLVGGTVPSQRGVFHMAAGGEASWADFAEAIFAASAARGGPFARVRRITTAEYPTPASRPANSRLDSSRIAVAHGVTLPPWQEALAQVIARLQPAG